MRRSALLPALLALAAPALAQTAPDPVDLRVKVRTEAVRQGLAPEIADAVATVESRYSPGARGDAGEVGLMQVMPPTARMLGFSGTLEELADPDTNIRYGVEYLAGAFRRAGGDVCTAAMKYRAGHGETRFSQKSVAYCARIRAVLAEQGYPVRGELPVATFGGPAPAVAANGKGGGKARARSRIDWAAHDRRIRSIEARMDAATGILR